MIKYLVNRAADTMRRRYNYDATYLREVADVSGGGALRIGLLLPMLSGYRAGCPVDLWAGAAIASTREGDCGPCLQLVIDMAIESGANPDGLRTALQGDPAAAGDTGLGFRFALAAINDDENLEELRSEIRRKFSDRALVSLSITAATGRTWPVIKRGLGHGHLCQSVRIDQKPVNLVHVEAGAASG